MLREGGNKEPVLTQINPYVISPEEKYYMTEERMEAYQRAMDAIAAHETEVRLSDSYDDNLIVLGLVRRSPYSFVLSDYDIGSDHKGMWFSYAYSEEECSRMMNGINQEYLDLINENITPDITELEKVLAIYRYFALRISYDYDWLEELNMSHEQYLFPHIVVYEAQKTNKGVCHTYTYLCEFAFQQQGIECVRATADMSDGSGGHMWPMVWIDGQIYHIDPTWDDHGTGVSLRYFGMTDEENIERGMVNHWSVTIEVALDIECSDTRFASWRDIVDYTLIGNHRMRVTRSDGSTELIDLTQY